MENTGIEWTDHTFNPWMGCEKVSAGCANCYAERDMDHRYGRVKWGPSGERVRTSASYWRKPIAWNKRAAAEGVRERVFCASLADVFEDRRELDYWRADLFDLIRRTPHLDWMLLTKRPECVRSLIDTGVSGPQEEMEVDWQYDANPPANVWLGTSVEDQAAADTRVPALLKAPAALRFLSCEPLLGPVDLRPWLDGIDWVIVGGESGPAARPMHPGWARSLRDQCVAAGVPFLLKQWGEWSPATHATHYLSDAGELVLAEGMDGPAPTEAQLRSIADPDSLGIRRVGKKRAGRLLDFKAWDQFPISPAAEREAAS
ncbi:MAG: phage Gp37/Gp68 family protein [Sumerlaeia bacterium]